VTAFCVAAPEGLERDQLRSRDAAGRTATEWLWFNFPEPVAPLSTNAQPLCRLIEISFPLFYHPNHLSAFLFWQTADHSRPF